MDGMGKRHDDAWVFADVRLMLVGVFLLFLGAAHEAFLYVLLAGVALLLVRWGVHEVRRRRRWRSEDPSEFWLDDLRQRRADQLPRRKS